MCTWAGYVGSEPAAGVLLDMARRQEGLWSGYYSGLCTLSGGELCAGKVVGALDKLTAETDVAAFAGSVGLVHSRTKSGGDRQWAHPFVSSDRQVAVVGQGSHGVFGSSAARAALGDELLDAGIRFSSATPGTVGQYPVLRDGCAIHTSELVAQAVAAEYANCQDPVVAVRRVIQRAPLEAIFAFLFRDRPGRLVIANVNQRLAVARDDAGIYLASSALVFPEGATWRTELPGNALAVVDRTGYRLERLSAQPCLCVDESIPAGVEEMALAFISANPGCTLARVHAHLSGAFVSGCLRRRGAVCYWCVERLLCSSLVRQEQRSVVGVLEGEQAPLTVFFASDAA